MSRLLDTNICIYAMKQHPVVLPRLLALRRADVFVSVVTEAELLTGAAKSREPDRTQERVERFLGPITVLEFTSGDAAVYAHLRAELERAGTPIGPLDLLIAAQALARQLTLVTNNEREFSRIASLRLENWTR